jgi:subtilisin family serine protease
MVPAWDITLGNKSVAVAIFDEGVSPGHPDIPLSAFSRNYVDNPPTGNVTPETNESTHGTACAGLAGATGNNGIGVSGVAPNITILGMKVLDWPNRRFASSTSIANALAYAGEHSDIGSISVGVFSSNTVRAAIVKLVSTGRNGKGYLLFKSSGNDNSDEIHDPGDMAEIISVGSSTDVGFRADYSNWGRAGTKTVDFLAPIDGGPNWTTDLPGALGEDPTDYTWQFGGTSAATPMAAGVAALILSVNPEYTKTEVLDLMRSTCDKIGGVTYVKGVHPEYGYGQLNAGAALKKIAVNIRSRLTQNGEQVSARVEGWRQNGNSLAYTIEVFAEADVQFEIFEPSTGRTYALLNQHLKPGRHAFTYSLPHGHAGLYFYRIRTGKKSLAGSVLLTNLPVGNF